MNSTTLYDLDRRGVQRQVRTVTRDDAEGFARLAAFGNRQNWYLGKLNGDLSHHSTASVSVYYWSISDAAWKDTTLDVTVRDFFTNTGESIPSGTCVRIEWNLTQWVVTSSTCTPSDWT